MQVFKISCSKKFQGLFSGKNKKNINLSSAVSVKNIILA